MPSTLCKCCFLLGIPYLLCKAAFWFLSDALIILNGIESLALYPLFDQNDKVVFIILFSMSIGQFLFEQLGGNCHHCFILLALLETFQHVYYLSSIGKSKMCQDGKWYVLVYYVGLWILYFVQLCVVGGMWVKARKENLQGESCQQCFNKLIQCLSYNLFDIFQYFLKYDHPYFKSNTFEILLIVWNMVASLNQCHADHQKSDKKGETTVEPRQQWSKGLDAMSILVGYILVPFFYLFFGTQVFYAIAMLADQAKYAALETYDKVYFWISAIWPGLILIMLSIALLMLCHACCCKKKKEKPNGEQELQTISPVPPSQPPSFEDNLPAPDPVPAPRSTTPRRPMPRPVPPSGVYHNRGVYQEPYVQPPMAPHPQYPQYGYPQRMPHSRDGYFPNSHLPPALVPYARPCPMNSYPVRNGGDRQSGYYANPDIMNSM